MTETAWNDLLDELRALGGKAENICLKTGPFGRGLFVVDSSKSVELRIPENVLVDLDDVVFEDGVFRVGPRSKLDKRERAFVERYEAEFAWGGGGRAETERFFESAQAIPEQARGFLTRELGMGFLFQEVTPEVVQKRFLTARTIEHDGRTVVMPVMDMVNYGHLATFAPVGVAVAGRFSDEILIRYSTEDSYGVFEGWGIASEESDAFSVSLRVNTRFGTLIVLRNYDDLPTDSQNRMPKLVVKGDEIHVPFLMLGNRKFPRLPKGIFCHVMKNAGYSNVEEIFEYIRHLNCLVFLEAIKTLDGAEGPMAQTIRKMAVLQLQTLSYCFGIRDPLAGPAPVGSGAPRR